MMGWVQGYQGYQGELRRHQGQGSRGSGEVQATESGAVGSAPGSEAAQRSTAQVLLEAGYCALAVGWWLLCASSSLTGAARARWTAAAGFLGPAGPQPPPGALCLRPVEAEKSAQQVGAQRAGKGVRGCRPAPLQLLPVRPQCLQQAEPKWA